MNTTFSKKFQYLIEQLQKQAKSIDLANIYM